jgi:hypothetical protein
LGSTKNTTGISTFCPPVSVCSVKQKHSSLLKYCPALGRRDVEAGGAGGRPRGQVLGGVIGHDPLARHDLGLVGLGLELPRQGGIDIGVEAHPDRRQRGLRARRRIGPHRGPAKAGHLAEDAVQRHAGVGEADHEQHEQHRRPATLRLRRRARPWRSTRVTG